MWHYEKQIGQWKRIDDPNIDPQIDDQLIFGKGEKAKVKNGERIVFSANDTGKVKYPYAKG